MSLSKKSSGPESKKSPKKESLTAVKQAVSRESRGFATVAYIPFLVFIPLILKRSDPFVRFHVGQGIVLFLFELVVMFLAPLPLIGWFLIGPLGWLSALALALLGIVRVMNDEEKELPLIGRYAEKIKI